LQRFLFLSMVSCHSGTVLKKVTRQQQCPSVSPHVWCWRINPDALVPLLGTLTAEPTQTEGTTIASPPRKRCRYALRTRYAVDRRIGTTDGLGGLFGLLQGMRSPVPSFVTHTTGGPPRTAVPCAGTATTTGDGRNEYRPGPGTSTPRRRITG